MEQATGNQGDAAAEAEERKRREAELKEAADKVLAWLRREAEKINRLP